MKTPDMSRLIPTEMENPFVSESHPMTGWVNDDVRLYAVIRSPAAKYEYPPDETSSGRIAGRTGM